MNRAQLIKEAAMLLKNGTPPKQTYISAMFSRDDNGRIVINDATLLTGNMRNDVIHEIVDKEEDIEFWDNTDVDAIVEHIRKKLIDNNIKTIKNKFYDEF